MSLKQNDIFNEAKRDVEESLSSKVQSWAKELDETVKKNSYKVWDMSNVVGSYNPFHQDRYNDPRQDSRPNEN